MRSLFTLVRRYPLLAPSTRHVRRWPSDRFCVSGHRWPSRWAGEPVPCRERRGRDCLGLCGVAGAVTATFCGKYIARVGIFRFNVIGAVLQLAAWGLFLAGADHYLPIIAGILLLDIGMQCIQLSNQATLFELCPSASNRINTIFMCSYFIGGSPGNAVFRVRPGRCMDGRAL